MKILILKPSSLGDVVQALPVLRLLKRHLPQSEIYWWIDSTLRSLLEGDSDLSGLFLFERWRWASPRHWNELLASIATLNEKIVTSEAADQGPANDLRDAPLLALTLT